MADHVAQQVTDAIKLRLEGLPTTLANVFGFRVNPLQEEELPGLCVFDAGDTAEVLTIHAPPLYDRDLEVHVIAYAQKNALLDETLNTMRKEVEAALGTALLIGTLALQLTYLGADKDFAPGEKQAGSIDMRFSARIANQADTPDVLA